MKHILIALVALLTGGAPNPQTPPPVVFHAVNCATDATGTEWCQVYLTGGSGTLWPQQSDNVKMSTMPKYSGDTIQDGVLPKGYTIGPKGLLLPTNPVGACNCGLPAAPVPPATVGVLVARHQ